MILPRRLFLTADGKFCEEDDVRQDKNYHPAGYPIPDQEAERIGLKAYLDETGWGEKAREKGERKVTEAAHEKALEQQKTENKAMDADDTEKKEDDKAAPSAKADADEKDEPPGPGLHIGGASQSRRKT